MIPGVNDSENTTMSDSFQKKPLNWELDNGQETIEGNPVPDEYEYQYNYSITYLLHCLTHNKIYEFYYNTGNNMIECHQSSASSGENYYVVCVIKRRIIDGQIDNVIINRYWCSFKKNDEVNNPPYLNDSNTKILYGDQEISLNKCSHEQQYNIKLIHPEEIDPGQPAIIDRIDDPQTNATGLSLTGLNTEVKCNKNQEIRKLFILDKSNNRRNLTFTAKVHSSEQFQDEKEKLFDDFSIGGYFNSGGGGGITLDEPNYIYYLSNGVPEKYMKVNLLSDKYNNQIPCFVDITPASLPDKYDGWLVKRNKITFLNFKNFSTVKDSEGKLFKNRNVIVKEQ